MERVLKKATSGQETLEVPTVLLVPLQHLDMITSAYLVMLDSAQPVKMIVETQLHLGMSKMDAKRVLQTNT
jgi:hypothetical protein